MQRLYVSAEVAESRAREHEWGTLSWLANEQTTGSTRLSAAKVVIRSAKRNPRHAHDDSDEILYLIEGTLEHSIGGSSLRSPRATRWLFPRGSRTSPSARAATMLS